MFQANNHGLNPIIHNFMFLTHLNVGVKELTYDLALLCEIAINTAIKRANEKYKLHCHPKREVAYSSNSIA